MRDGSTLPRGAAVAADDPDMSAHDHTQRDYWHRVLAVCSPAAFDDEPAAGFVPVAVSALFSVCALAFARLRVLDAGDALRIEFGPLRLFRRRVRYAETGAGASTTSTRRRCGPEFRMPWGTPLGATSSDPAVIGSVRSGSRKSPSPESTW